MEHTSELFQQVTSAKEGGHEIQAYLFCPSTTEIFAWIEHGLKTNN